MPLAGIQHTEALSAESCRAEAHQREGGACRAEAHQREGGWLPASSRKAVAVVRLLRRPEARRTGTPRAGGGVVVPPKWEHAADEGRPPRRSIEALCAECLSYAIP